MEQDDEERDGKTMRKGRRSRAVIVVAAFLCVVAVLGAASVWFLARSVETARGTHQESVTVTLSGAEGVFTFASDLKRQGVIGSELPFLYYLFREDLRTKLKAGNYSLSGAMPIRDIVAKIVRGETVEKGIKVTFPEGMTAAEMAARLDANGLPGAAFLSLVTYPDAALRGRYPFLASLPVGATLEGFLFPDTYFFDSKLGADAIIAKMLDGFKDRAVPMLSGVPVDKRYASLILASIVEMEVRTDADRKTVADLFLRRIVSGMPLQSDATVRYALGVTKVKHSLADISIDSPYNTYANKGLPPGPVSNPGLSSIRAVLNPTPNTYLYFLNNPSTGETVFSTTFDEHVANKAKNGL
ncbi:MAG TPA: endolytic transglycosylase MltG [Candidatus Fimivivens sp.]|nr:endolytic transglycosylase MltG [Candidatus Fimivivens sp.]